MPELPEVETSCRGIKPHIEGATLQKVTVRNAKLRWPVPVAELTALEGRTLNAVQRRGKYLKLIFDSGYILLHLGMSGNVRIVQQDEVIQKHDHIDFSFTNGNILRLNDPRRFGCCLYQADNSVEHDLLKVLGPEPLADVFNAELLYQCSRGKKQAVKTFIMDGHVVVGVGNIYAAESLFRAGINPKRAAGNISKARYIILVQVIKAVLAEAIAQGGTTLKDFVGGDGKPGYFKQELQVYGRAGEPCTICSQNIKKINQGQRSTFYCSHCQK
ncbi:MAG: bifunctional DNA-formamidopyrimidine glycosylase/DNA-(apurinic or apyrimidinic site) lyase [Pseudomonadales bacterium]|nr:bifunctional DNA-formamidopyrimidine glycosylase/DNA-(apurinic or apyrimidinic site) lyase [Pseudomonadales bacterium]